MTIFVVTCVGKYTDTVNGEAFTTDRAELLKAFTVYDEAVAFVKSIPDVKEPAKWGVRAIGVETVELEEECSSIT